MKANLKTVNAVSEKPNYGKALEELGNIAQKIKALDEDDSTEPSGRKRLSSDTAGATPESASEAKKPRTSKESASVETSKEAVVKKKLQKISRKVISLFLFLQIPCLWSFEIILFD